MSEVAAAPAATEVPAASTTTPAGTPNATPTSASAPAPTDWTMGLNDDLKSYVQNKGFKDTAAVVESYRNFEKLHGVPHDRIMKLPENLDSPEGRAIFERLGAPKDAKDYSINLPKENADEALANGLREVAHKTGMTQRQVENIVNWWNGLTEERTKQTTEQMQMKLNDAQNNLKKEWGAAFEQNKQIADQGAIKMGMGEAEIKALGQALGPDKAMQLLYKLGRSTGEAEFIAGQAPGGNIMSPQAAIAEIKRLSQDPAFGARLLKGDADATQQWNKLNQWAYPT